MTTTEHPLQQPSDREQAVIKGVLDILRTHLNPEWILLFGSRAKGKARKGSDFDFAVDQHEPSPRLARAISDEIEECAGLYSVDVVYLKDAAPAFKSLILKKGKIIYER